MVDTDYITKESALSCFHDWIDRYGHEHSADEMTEYQRIEDLPVADVVEVVQCKDCAKYDPDAEWCNVWEYYLQPDFFCALGHGDDNNGNEVQI